MNQPLPAPSSTYQPSDPAQIEPGLLSVFRMMLALQLLFALVRLDIPRVLGAEEIIPSVILFRFRHPGPPEEPFVEPAERAAIIQLRQEQPLAALVSIAWLALLLGYLSWPWLRRQLGRAYLPVALVTVTLFLLLERALMLWLWMQQADPQWLHIATIGSSGRLWVGLLLPMVLIAWQYQLRHVVGYLACIVALNVMLTGWVAGLANWPNLLRDEMAPATVFTVIGYVVTRMMAGQRQQRQALAEANTQLSQHAATLEQLTVSRERNRLARELHDTLAHTLSAVSVQLEAVDSAWEAKPAKARELLAKSLAQTRSGLTETRRALQALRASPLDDLGLTLALRNLAESTAQRGGLQLQANIDDLKEPLAPDTEQHLYRIAQEAMTNVLRHAGARSVRIDLTQANGELVLAVADDGGGFDVGQATVANGRFGLDGMRERAELLGATLTVQSDPGHGATVRLVWPGVRRDRKP